MKQVRKPGITKTGTASRRGDESTVEGNLKLLLDSDDPSVEVQRQLDLAADTSVDAPLIRLVNCLLAEAVRANASDIHIEPFESILRVRFRIDGILQEVQKVPPKLASSVSSRLKIMAALDICERRVPQDGSFKLNFNGVQAEFRMSTLPSAFGEKIVLRVMSSAAVNNDLSKLGIPEAQLRMLRDSITRPDGLVLVTGPTGSGKTTTLYAALNELNDISVSVFTAEDPIEGTLQGVTQCQVNPGVGYSFASILRSLLRQDPDVILVGEIRDQETAEISIKAALTGHLVLSTLHTNCAVSTIQRLLNMGVQPYLITTSVNCVVAQRLVRRVCQHCKVQVNVPQELLKKLGAGADVLDNGVAWHGKGCEHCRNLGYSGRAPLYEVLIPDDQFRQMILEGASKDDLKAYAVRAGMITLRRAGLDLVRAGVTSIEEVLGATTDEGETNKTPEPVVVNPPASAARQGNTQGGGASNLNVSRPTNFGAVTEQARAPSMSGEAPVNGAVQHAAQNVDAAIPTFKKLAGKTEVPPAPPRPTAPQIASKAPQARWKSARVAK